MTRRSPREQIPSAVHSEAVVTGTTKPGGNFQIVKVLGGSTRERVTSFPDSLTFAESGLPGFEASAWFGLYAPRGTSRDIVNKINAETQRIIATPAFHEKVLALYFGEAITSSADEFANFIKSGHQKWGNVIRDAKIDKLD